MEIINFLLFFFFSKTVVVCIAIFVFVIQYFRTESSRCVFWTRCCCCCRCCCSTTVCQFMYTLSRMKTGLFSSSKKYKQILRSFDRPECADKYRKRFDAFYAKRSQPQAQIIILHFFPSSLPFLGLSAPLAVTLSILLYHTHTYCLGEFQRPVIVIQ